VHFSDKPNKNENVCIGTHLNIFFASPRSKVVSHKCMTCINGLIFCTQRLKILCQVCLLRYNIPPRVITMLLCVQVLRQTEDHRHRVLLNAQKEIHNWIIKVGSTSYHAITAYETIDVSTAPLSDHLK